MGVFWGSVVHRSRAYTLIEVLVALTIIVVLAGLLAPVFVQAREESRRAACTMNFRQVSLSSTLYQIDYDDRYVVAKYTAGIGGNAVTDRTWVQLVQPYLRSFDSTKCPSDFTQRPTNLGLFDEDLRKGDTAGRFYTISQRANTGYNFIYLAPLVLEQTGQWISRSRSTSELQDPSNTLVFGDSVWEVTPEGLPNGGGSYLIVPPCRWMAPERVDSFGLGLSYPNSRIYTASMVWDEPAPTGATHFGGLWPWHTGRMTTVMADGSARAMTPERVTAGCDVRVRWRGMINDSERYIWDMR